MMTRWKGVSTQGAGQQHRSVALPGCPAWRLRSGSSGLALRLGGSGLALAWTLQLGGSWQRRLGGIDAATVRQLRPGLAAPAWRLGKSVLKVVFFAKVPQRQPNRLHNESMEKYMKGGS